MELWVALFLFVVIDLQPGFGGTETLSRWNVCDFGAVGDGKTLDTQPIQKAIDHCSAQGGGRVGFPPGSYLTGTLFLKNGVILDLDHQATLLGSQRLDDFPLTLCGFPSYSDSYCGRALIWGEGLENIGIVGQGVIDGQGEAFKDNRPADSEAAIIARGWQDPSRYTPRGVYINRPYIIRLISCRNIRIEGVTLRDSPMWMQHYLNCDRLLVRGITVFNHCSANNDMIDIDCCRDVVISDCIGDSDDDALTLKSTAPCPTENVTITNCILSSYCNAIKMGTESNGGFKNISISNCVIRPSVHGTAMSGDPDGLAGIALEIVDGGILDGVTISNITLSGQTTPIFIRLGNRARPHLKGGEKPNVGSLRNVVLSNIVACGAGKIPCSITGLPEQKVEGITLNNILIESSGGDQGDLNLSVPENPGNYPENTMFGRLPAYGFYCRHAEKLTFRNVRVQFTKEDQRPPYIFDDVHNLFLDQVSGKVTGKTVTDILLRDVVDAMIQSCHPDEGRAFLNIHKGCQGIVVTGNNLSKVQQPFLLEEPGLESALSAFANQMP